MRHIAAKLHRYVGLSLAAFLIVVGLTGSALVFQHELDAWLNPSLFKSESFAEPLAVQELITRVESSDPRSYATYVAFPETPGDSAMVRLSPRPGFTVDDLGYTEAYTNPGTGEVLGRRHWGSCCFERENLVPWIYRLHYTLHMPGRLGSWLIGSVALLWSIDCLIGLYLTFPRRSPFFARWWKAWKVKTSAGTPRMTFDLHRATGLWLWGVLLVLAISGVYFNLNREVFRPVVEAFSEATPYPFETRSDLQIMPGQQLIDFDTALASAGREAARLGWTNSVRGVAFSESLAYYSIYYQPFDDIRAGMSGPLVYVDARDGAIVDKRVPLSGTAADVIYSLQFPVHSGQIAGLPGRLVIFLAGVVTALLSVTGVMVWARRTLRTASCTIRTAHGTGPRVSPASPVREATHPVTIRTDPSDIEHSRT